MTPGFLEGLFDEVTGSDLTDYEVTVCEGTVLEDADRQYTIEGLFGKSLFVKGAVCKNGMIGCLGACLTCGN